MKKEKVVIIKTPLGIENSPIYKIYQQSKKNINEAFFIDKDLLGKDNFNKQFLGSFDFKNDN